MAEVVNLPRLEAPGDGKDQVRITETGAGGATLLDWQSQRAFGGIPTEVIADRGDVLNLRIAFNPVRDYARVFGDFINYDARGEIHEGGSSTVGSRRAPPHEGWDRSPAAFRHVLSPEVPSGAAYTSVRGSGIIRFGARRGGGRQADATG